MRGLVLGLLVMSAGYAAAYGAPPPPPPPPPAEYPETVDGYDVGWMWGHFHSWAKRQVGIVAEVAFKEAIEEFDGPQGEVSPKLMFEHWGDRYWYREMGAYSQVCLNVDCNWHYTHVRVSFANVETRAEQWATRNFDPERLATYLKTLPDSAEKLTPDFTDYADPSVVFRDSLIQVSNIPGQACAVVEDIGRMYGAVDPATFKNILSVKHSYIAHGRATSLTFSPSAERYHYEVRGRGPVVDFVEMLKRPTKECNESEIPK